MIFSIQSDGLDQQVNDPVATQAYSKFLIILVSGIVGDEHGLLLKNHRLRLSKRISLQTSPADCTREASFFCYQHASSWTTIGRAIYLHYRCQCHGFSLRLGLFVACHQLNQLFHAVMPGLDSDFGVSF